MKYSRATWAVLDCWFRIYS